MAGLNWPLEPALRCPGCPGILAVAGRRLPHTLARGWDTGLPASGRRAGLRLCRAGKQRVVLLLEGKVLESPHGQGSAQALPGESRGEARREAGFSGPAGTYHPPLRVQCPITHSFGSALSSQGLLLPVGRTAPLPGDLLWSEYPGSPGFPPSLEDTEVWSGHSWPGGA